MYRTISVFAAIFCGVLIGALIGSTIETSLPFGNYLWTVGALIGGLFAYCMVDFGHFKAGAAKAWVATKIRSKAASEKITGWRPYRPYWTAVGTFQGAGFALLGSALLYCLPGFLLAKSIVDWMNGTTWASSVPLVLLALGLLILGTLYMAFFLAGLFATMFAIILMVGSPFVDLRHEKEDVKYLRRLKQERETASQIIEAFNPIAVAKSAWMRLMGAPRYTKIAGAFLWLWLRSAGWFAGYTVAFVHSEARVICLVDTAIFVVVAHLLGLTLQGNLIAAVAGGIFGVVNYLVVSVWWLKLVPARASTS